MVSSTQTSWPWGGKGGGRGGGEWVRWEEGSGDRRGGEEEEKR